MMTPVFERVINGPGDALLTRPLQEPNSTFDGSMIMLIPSSQKTSALPDYSADKFVNREGEVKLVVDRAKALVDKPSPAERTLIFMGQRGTGKSWLMRHLALRLEEKLATVRSVLIDLKDYADRQPDAAVKDILTDLARDLLPSQTIQRLDLPDMSREFMRHLRPLTVKQPLVLLIDTVFESDWHLLAMLERYLLGPLAAESNVLIVMAGRGQAYPWKTPELRLRATFHDLKPFDEEFTRTQLKQHDLDGAIDLTELHESSQGNPLANYMLAAQSAKPVDGLNQTIDQLLEIVPDPEERRQIREYLEALCVLNAFDEEQIPAMLAAYYPDKEPQAWKPPQARQVRERLVRWSFAHWDEKRKGYVIESTLLNLLQRYLKKGRPDQWKAQHFAASQLYRAWAEKYKRTSKRWEAEAEYHLSQLDKPGLSPENRSG